MADPEKTPRKPRRLVIDGIEIDVTLSENTQLEVSLTDLPVEEGSNFSDQATPMPDGLTVEGYCSPMPPLSGTADAANTGYTLGTMGRAREFYDRLWELSKKPRLIVIVTPRRTYENMMLKSASLPRSLADGDGFTFSASFKEFIIVSTERVTFQASNKSGAKRQNKGLKPTSPTPGKVRNASLLTKGAETAGKAWDGLKSLTGLGK